MNDEISLKPQNSLDFHSQTSKSHKFLLFINLKIQSVYFPFRNWSENWFVYSTTAAQLKCIPARIRVSMRPICSDIFIYLLSLSITFKRNQFDSINFNRLRVGFFFFSFILSFLGAFRLFFFVSVAKFTCHTFPFSIMCTNVAFVLCCGESKRDSILSLCADVNLYVFSIITDTN